MICENFYHYCPKLKRTTFATDVGSVFGQLFLLSAFTFRPVVQLIGKPH